MWACTSIHVKAELVPDSGSSHLGISFSKAVTSLPLLNINIHLLKILRLLKINIFIYTQRELYETCIKEANETYRQEHTADIFASLM